MQELWWVWMRRCYVPSRFWNQPRRRPSTHMAGWMRDGLWHPRASQRRRIARYRTKEVMQGGPNCPIVLLTRHNLNPSISLILYHGPHFLLVTSPNFLLLSPSFVGFRFPFPSVFVLCLLFHCFFCPSVHRRWHMIWWFLIICSMPYFHKYGYCMERGLGNGKDSVDRLRLFFWLSMVISGLSCSETWWCPGPIWGKKEKFAAFSKLAVQVQTSFPLVMIGGAITN